MESLNREFVLLFQQLDDCCNERFECLVGGVKRYIAEMEQVFLPEAEDQHAWNADCGFLKYCCEVVEHIRQKPAETVCSENDLEFLSAFYNRMLEDVDPLTLFLRASAESEPADERKERQYVPAPPISEFYKPYVPKRKTGVYIVVAGIFILIFLFGFLICRKLF